MSKKTRSFLALACFYVQILIILTPAQAITTTVKPSAAIVNSTDDAYTATFDPTGGPSGGFFFLNLTIPAGYNLTLPAVGRTVGDYTMLNKTAGTNKVIINITSNNSDAKTVDVRFSTNYGASYSTELNKSILNMNIGVATLNITEPTSTTSGSLNISLQGAGPIDPTRNNVTIKLANGTLRNPINESSYAWYLEAKSSPTGTAFTSFNVVSIKAGASEVVVKPVLNATTPVVESLPLPAGNLTVNITTIPGVVVANFIMTLRNFSDDPIPEQTAGASGLSRVMFIGIDVPALQGVTFTAKVSVNYSSVVSILAIPEANLKLYRFNDTSSTWEVGSNNIVDTVNKIVSADFNSFSTFAIMGATSVSSGGGPGGGSGGGGMITSEPFNNIAKSERYDKSLIANTPVTYIFKAPEHGIYEITITGKENENDIALRVEALKTTSKLVTASPPGTVYKNLNIWAGTQRIKEAIIRFKVNNSWLDSNKAASSDIRMLKWDGSKWIELETQMKNKDDSFTYLEAKTDTFSSFAIVGLKESGTVVQPTIQQPQPTVSAVSTPTERAQQGGTLTGIILGILGFAVPVGEGGVRSSILIITLLNGILVIVLLRISARRKR